MGIGIKANIKMTTNRRKALNARYHQLVSFCKLDETEKKAILREATKGLGTKPESSTELTDTQLLAAINLLETRVTDSTKRMRAKAINLARDHNLVVGEAPNINWTGLNDFTTKTWKKPFYKLTNTELRHCITALEKWQNYNQIKALNEII